MNDNGSNQKTTGTSQNKVERSFLAILRTLTIIAVATGGVCSFVLTLRAGHSSPRLLLVVFLIWVLSPFVALAWANMISTRWSRLTRTTLVGTSLFITLISLAFYSKIISPPAGSANAFIFIVVPLASWFLAAILVTATILLSRKRSR